MRRNWSMFALMLVVAALISACGAAPAAPAGSSEGAPAKSYKIGFANLTEDVVFTKLVREGIERKAKEMGVELVLASTSSTGPRPWPTPRTSSPRTSTA